MKATYIKTELKTTINVSKIVTIHSNEYGKNFIFKGEKHDFWELVYVDKGQVLIESDNDKIILSQGEIIFHRPNEFHAIRSYNSSPNFFVISFVCNSFAMKYFEKLHTALDRTLQSFITSVIEEAKNSYVISKNDPYLFKLTKKENALVGSEQLIKTFLEQFLILLIRKITTHDESTIFPNKESMENHLITSVKKIIQNNVDRCLRVNDICESLGYSKSYLSRVFKEQTGETLASYSVKVKIDKAKRLIRENNLNFTQISDQLSFDNPQYFSRVFKRVTGMSPTEFKSTLNLSS